ncbi:hypothetical protein GJ700_23225 [Duganella sp. FT92W]|uniref:Uncharacterized protein n=2 Tax=Pseudoduganella rivuli TaxID=2666085 RepID=A0A7X2LUN8_9BURK|nr:hypothetical protein [Pseudoduganella rivuli]
MRETRLSFTPAAAPQGGWRLMLAALGILALLPAGAHWLRAYGDVQALQARIAAAQPRRAAPVPLPPAVQREQEQQVKVVAEAVRQLNLPVPRLLKTLQAPPDIHVALLGVDLNGQPAQDGGDTARAAPQGPAGSLKIAAEAETARDMLNYLAFLSQQPLFRSVYLIKHEQAASDQPRPYRFQLEAQWRQ